MSAYSVASDIGGTFTDTVVIDEDGRVGRYKSPTVPANPAEAVLDTLRVAAEERGLSIRDFLGSVGLFSHGTTVATNAMIQNRRASVGLVQTRGFADTLSIMHGFKSLGLDEERIKRFRDLVKAPVAVPERLTAEVTERVDYRGRVLLALDEDDVRRAIADLRAAGAEVFAVSLPWSFKNDTHERRVAELIREEVPDAEVTCSSSDVLAWFAAGRPLTDFDEIDGEREVLPGVSPAAQISAGEVFRWVVHNGGGDGDPLREPERVAEDVRSGAVTTESAAALYGVVLSDVDVDEDATATRREEIRAGRRSRMVPPQPGSGGGAPVPAGRWGASLTFDGAVASCAHCGAELGPLVRVPVELRIEQWVCPSCVVSLWVHVVPVNGKTWRDFAVTRGGAANVH